LIVETAACIVFGRPVESLLHSTAAAAVSADEAAAAAAAAATPWAAL
jgi:hypothetical protein